MVVAEHFGAEVRDLVLEVTEDPALPRGGRKDREREHALALSPRARLVRLADKAHNLFSLIDHPPVTWSHERQAQYAEWCADLVRALGAVNGPLEAHFVTVLHRVRAVLHARAPKGG